MVLSLIPPEQPKERWRFVRVGDEGRVGWEGAADCAVPALLPWPDVTLLLYCTASPVLLLLLARPCTSSIPSAGPCGVGGNVLMPGASVPQPLTPCCSAGQGPLSPSLNATLSYSAWDVVLLRKVNPGLSPQAAVTPGDPGDPALPALPCTCIRARQQNHPSCPPQTCQGILAGQGIFLFPPKDGTRIHQK